MRKKRLYILLYTLLFTAFLVAWGFGNPAIRVKHDGKKKNGQNVGVCGYCHNQTLQIPQRKSGYKKDQALYSSLADKPACAGSGCHVKK